jgi:plasmid stability protein
MAKTVTLSVKNVPVAVAKRLKDRAARNNRSLQGELQSILEEAGHVLTLDDLAALAKRLGIKGTSGESARMIREDRDDPRR